VLITGASGGVGSAAVQLARRRGAHITAITSADKIEAVRQLGCDQLLTRDSDLLMTLGEESIDVVVDNVAGRGFGGMIKVLQRGGRYVSSGAIAGPIVAFDMRDLYLKDIALMGCTAWDEPVFPNLVSYIEQGQIRPLVAKVFALQDIALAQQEFMEKRHVGNFVLVPPGV
jgi:alcohol dehydrogenase